VKNGMTTETEESPLLRSVTRKRLGKQSKKTAWALMICKASRSAIAL
jgi:hypothetical protein